VSTEWTASQILGIRPSERPTRRFVNPRPGGVMVPGSATTDVWNWLQERSQTSWWTRRQIVIGTGRSGKSVDWALIFLRTTKKIEVARDNHFTRYQRYRVLR
jgi:hypothetical protein